MEARADYESRIATAKGAGRREGIKEGIKEGKLLAIVDIVREGYCSVEVGADKAGMTVEEFENAMHMINSMK